MALAVFKSEVTNHNPNAISYQKCKHSDSDKFKTDVLDKLSMQDLLTMNHKVFKDILIDSLNYVLSEK